MSPAGSPARALLAAALGGLAYCFGHVGFGLWPLAFVCWVPLWRALEGASWRRAVGLGFVFGAAAYGPGYRFLWSLVEEFLEGDAVWGGLLWALHGVWFAAGFAVAAVVFCALRRRGRSVLWCGLASVLPVEWLQPQLFPAYQGASLIHALPLAQLARFGGPLLLTAFLLAMNAGVASLVAWRRDERPFPRGPALGALAGALASALFGTLALQIPKLTLDAVRIGVVQANLGVREKREHPAHSHRRHLALSRGLLDGGPLDLLVWPETAYGLPLQRRLPMSGRLVREGLDVPLLFGATTSSVARDGERRRYNSALLVSSDGAIRDVYDKIQLVPFAERLPFERALPGLTRQFPRAQRFDAGAANTSLALSPWRFATPICHEVLDPTLVRRLAHEGEVHVIVTLANDAWFGRSQAPWMHLHLARLRAIENGRPLVRATNSGVSAVIDANGRIVAQTALLEEATLRATVRPNALPTLYGRLGDWPGALGVLALGLGSMLPERKR